MKTIIITGANGNLGRVVTHKFLNKGYKVIATVSNESKNKFIKHENLAVYVLNLEDERATNDFVNKVVQQYTAIDAGFFFAGGFAMGNIEETSGDDIKQQLALNFETAYYIARPLFKHMMQNKQGKLVFIAAKPALNAAEGKNKVAYTLSKSLLFKLSELLNAEAKGTNVVSSVIVPNIIDTPSNRESMPDENFANWTKPEAIADILLIVCSDKASGLRETVLKVYGNA